MGIKEEEKEKVIRIDPRTPRLAILEFTIIVFLILNIYNLNK